MRYLDSGSRKPEDTLHRWLRDELPGASFFGGQTGYFTFDALAEFETEVRHLLDGGGQFRLVVGGNEDRLSAADLEDALRLIEPYSPRASLVLVSAPDVLMHPKTFFVEHPSGYRAAIVGSANLTGSGLGANIEACVAFDSAADKSAPLNEVKAAIEAWRIGSRPNAVVLSQKEIDRLVASGEVLPPVAVKPASGRGRSARAMFPRMGRIVVVRRRRRRRPSAYSSANVGIRLRSRGVHALPSGMTGIAKRLSRLDTKGFRGERGTLYISLPRDLLPYLPMRPSGRNAEPRWDVTIEARLLDVPAVVVGSGGNPTNITAVGHGARRTSHRDVRLNILRVIVSGVDYASASAGVPTPAPGDFVAIELVPGGNLLRLTFVTGGPIKRALDARCGHQSWTWLPVGMLPAW